MEKNIEIHPSMNAWGDDSSREQKNIDMSFPTNYVDGLVFAIQATVMMQ